MPFAEILIEGLQGSLHTIGQIALIVIPLMVFIEIFKDMDLLHRLTSILSPLTKGMGLPAEARLPIMAGLVFGISYGGGLIISSAREGKLSYRDIYIINLFLIICHSVFEDTLLFAAVGARWLPILAVRLVLAVVVCYMVSKFFDLHHKDSANTTPTPERITTG
ncbi:MAG: nucleoside recognition domain-containing protein [Syntrophomonadaceae bacterium]